MYLEFYSNHPHKEQLHCCKQCQVFPTKNNFWKGSSAALNNNNYNNNKNNNKVQYAHCGMQRYYYMVQSLYSGLNNNNNYNNKNNNKVQYAHCGMQGYIITWHSHYIKGCHRGPGAGNFPRLLWAWPPAIFVGSKRKRDHKNSLALEFPTLLIAYTQQLEILVTAFHIYINLL